MYIEPFDDWHESTIEDAKEIGKILGIDIDNVYFSGFWSQGDGACFTGSYSYAKGATKAIRQYAPLDKELHRIADDLQELQRKHFYGLSTTVTHSGHYSHEYCTQFSTYDRDEYADADTDEALIEILRDYMRWIYRNLEREYEYQTKWSAARAVENLREDICGERAKHSAMIRAIWTGEGDDAVGARMRESIRDNVSAFHREIRDIIDTYGSEILTDDYA